MCVSLLMGCTNESVPPVKQQEIYHCYRQTAWDSLQIAETLVGKWQWEYEDCAWTSGGSDRRYAGLNIEFNSDGTLDVYQNKAFIQTSNWQINLEDSDLYGLQLDPAVGQLYGRILICGNSLEFNDSYIDACDNYFKRIK